MKNILLKKEYVEQGPLILVNRQNTLKTKIQSYNLVPFNSQYPEILLEYNCHAELQQALYEIRAGDRIVPVSGYRSKEKQEEIYQESLQENGKTFTQKYVAYPDCSEHQTGLAIDLALRQDHIDFIRPQFPNQGICQEFRNHMANYGFIQRYPEEKEKITQIASEEWHFRYVGYPHSEIIRKNGVCLEEYLEDLKQYKYGKSSYIFQDYEISYLEMDENLKEITMADDERVTISGNNENGVIITKRKKKASDRI